MYNCVSYIKKEDMDALLNDINGLVITKCGCSGQCMHDLSPDGMIIYIQ